MPSKRILSTKNCKLFEKSSENRPTDLKKRRPLIASMKKYGFLWMFPIVVQKVGSRYVVTDGQHRLVIAEELGLPVYYVISDVAFDIAEVNGTQKPWAVRDYALNHAENGKADYQEVIDFADRHRLSLSLAAALLAGKTSYGKVKQDFVGGEYTVTERTWADTVASVLVPTLNMAAQLNKARFTEACMAVCRVSSFDPKRFLQNASRCREKLVPLSTRDAYLHAMEEIYNYGRKQKIGLKAAATMALSNGHEE